MPGGWNGGPRGTIFLDDQVVHGGRLSVRIERDAASPNDISTITKSIPLDFSCATIELRGYLRTEGASGFVGLWLCEDGYSPGLAFDNMESRQLKGTTPWTEYSIKLPVDPEANRIFFGILLAGTGKAWADDLQLLVDDKPVWDAPKVERPKTALDIDHEFDSGSRINITELSSIQVEDLVKLGKIWGYLKYYHPGVTAGQYHSAMANPEHLAILKQGRDRPRPPRRTPQCRERSRCTRAAPPAKARPMASPPQRETRFLAEGCSLVGVKPDLKFPFGKSR